MRLMALPVSRVSKPLNSCDANEGSPAGAKAVVARGVASDELPRRKSGLSKTSGAGWIGSPDSAQPGSHEEASITRMIMRAARDRNWADSVNSDSEFPKLYTQRQQLLLVRLPSIDRGLINGLADLRSAGACLCVS